MIKIAVVLLLVTSTGISQPVINDAAQKMYHGVTETLGWHDAPFAIYMYARNSFFVHDNNKSLSIKPFGFDKSIQKSIGKSGRESIGGMDHNTIPGIIMYSRAAITLAINIIDKESVSKDDYKRIFLFYKSVLYTHAITEFAKNIISRQRPDDSDTRSFFSGHSSVTFAAASFLYRELDDYIDHSFPSDEDNSLCFALKAASFSVLYGWAGYVAYSRMYDNKHYLSDVLLGAAAGSLISNFVYNEYFGNENDLLNNFSIGMVNRSPSLSFTLTF